jgi:hypothetical protein
VERGVAAVILEVAEHSEALEGRRHLSCKKRPVWYDPHMTKDQVKAVLDRVSTWPQERQEQLAEIALEIEAGIGQDGYHATPEELEAIDEGLRGEAASKEEVEAAFATFRRG